MRVEIDLAESLLKLFAFAQSEFAGPDQVNYDSDFPSANEEHSSSVIDPVDSSLIFDYLLGEELDFERVLSKTGYVVDCFVEQGLVFMTDNDEHIMCRVGAVINDGESRRFLVVLESPVVGCLVRGGGQRSSADRIRVATYLVRLGSNIVGRSGNGAGFFGDPVGFLREGVRTLGELVRLARLEQRDDSGNEAEGAERNSTDCADFLTDHIPIHNSSPNSEAAY
jgi:hypothetical protein